jgi:site-specific DNA recombinase
MSDAIKRAAIYARYSSDNQRDASIEDQVRNCMRLVEERGWQIAGVYSDRAQSGATTLRVDFQRMLADARSGRFDVIVAEGLDRLSRDQEATAGLFKQMQFLGVAIVTRQEGEISELHVGLKGTMNALFLKDLAEKTHRGLEGRVRQGKSGGGRAFGYDIVRDRDASGEVIRGVRKVNESEAVVVERIFSDFAAGKSPRAIARALNEEGVKGPQGRPWRDTTIRGHATRRTGILRNDLYAGALVWNKQEYLRNPETGKRVARPNSPDEVVREAVPHLRIVDEALWTKVQDRLGLIAESPRAVKNRAASFRDYRRPKHLLTGLIKCGTCGGNLAATGQDYLACTAARSGAGCSNRTSVKRSHIERVVLDGLRERLMMPDAIAAFTRAFHAELNRKRADDQLLAEAYKRELAQVGKKISGIIDAVAMKVLTGPHIRAEMDVLCARRDELARLIEVAPPPAPRFHPKLAEQYRAEVERLHAALSVPDARSEAADRLRRLIECVTVRTDASGQFIELTGDISMLITLPGGKVPDPYKSSVQVVAGACNQLDLQLAELLRVCCQHPIEAHPLRFTTA